MKKILSFIFIAMMVFPLSGSVFAASSQANSAVASQKILIANLNTIYTRLYVLTNKTQVALNQLNANNYTSTAAESDILDANISLSKAKGIIDKLSTQTNTENFKPSLSYAESALEECRSHILATLADLKAALPAIDTTNQ